MPFITNIYQQGELMQSATVRKFRTVIEWRNESHDRWLIIDDSLYHCDHSLNANGGHKISAITLMGISPEVILSRVE